MSRLPQPSPERLAEAINRYLIPAYLKQLEEERRMESHFNSRKDRPNR